jgi:hypothetical protein
MSYFSEIADCAMTIGQQMSKWIGEADELNFLSTLKKLTNQQKKRLADLNSGIDTCEVCIEDGSALPNQPWITRALKPA